MIVLKNLSKTGTFFCFFGLNKQMHFSGGTTMRIHRVSVLLLCLILLTGVFTGCKKEEDSGNTITYIPTFYPLGAVWASAPWQSLSFWVFALPS